MAEKQKRIIRPWFIVAGVLVFFLIFPIMYIFGSVDMAKNAGICKTKECFITAANSCENSTFYSTEDIGFVKYETSGCFFMKTLMNANKEELPEIKELVEGKSLICQYDYGNFDSRWIDSISDGIEFCQGDLKEAIGELFLFSE